MFGVCNISRGIFGTFGKTSYERFGKMCYRENDLCGYIELETLCIRCVYDWVEFKVGCDLLLRNTTCVIPVVFGP